jgi:hypothetical integral membrane protein (TIGR02206 family)
MNRLQIGFILATFLVPLVLWLAVRLWRGERPPDSSLHLERIIARSLAAILVCSYVGALLLKQTAEGLSLDQSLPCHLCDWAAVVTLIALLGRKQAPFELAYCWGLAGTLQGLLTPAVQIDGGLRSWCFLAIHSVIPASVIWMILGRGMRPSWACWRRVAFWSEIYFLVALLTNDRTRSNYGFLARRPDNPSLLDFFPDNWWLYVLTVNAFALCLFALMLAPWRMTARLR